MEQQYVNGEARMKAAVLEQAMAGCREACAAHRSELSGHIASLTEQVNHRMTTLETACGRMTERVQALEVDAQVGKARLDAGSLVKVAIINGVFTAAVAVLMHFVGK